MLGATFFYSGSPPVTITLSPGYGHAELAHGLVTIILISAELPVLLDRSDSPWWIERERLVALAVGEHTDLARLGPPGMP